MKTEVLFKFLFLCLIMTSATAKYQKSRDNIHNTFNSMCNYSFLRKVTVGIIYMTIGNIVCSMTHKFDHADDF